MEHDIFSGGWEEAGKYGRGGETDQIRAHISQLSIDHVMIIALTGS